MRRWRWSSCSIVLSRRKSLRRRRRKRNRFGCPERKGRIAPAFFVSGTDAKSGGKRQSGTNRGIEYVVNVWLAGAKEGGNSHAAHGGNVFRHRHSTHGDRDSAHRSSIVCHGHTTHRWTICHRNATHGSVSGHRYTAHRWAVCHRNAAHGSSAGNGFAKFLLVQALRRPSR